MIKGYIIYLLMLCQCTSISTQETQTSTLPKSVFTKLLEENELWVNSWDVKPSIFFENFNLEYSKSLEVNWQNFDFTDKHTKSFDSLLIKNNDLSIDMYSYNTNFFAVGDNIKVEFEVDTKVFINDKANSQRIEVLTIGTYERLEDCIWLDKDTIILVGYLEEDQKQPFVWTINITSKVTKFYVNNDDTQNQRGEFFKLKFPNIIME